MTQRHRGPRAAVVVAAILTTCTSCSPDVGDSPRQTGTPVVRYSLDNLLNSVSYSGLILSPDGTNLLTSSNASGTFQLVELPLDGSAARTITEGSQSSNMAVGYFPSGDRMLFSADRDGDEQFRLYAGRAGGDATDVIGEGRTTFLGWKSDGSAFFVGNDSRDPRVSDVYEVSVEDYGTRRIFENDDLYIPGPVSQDGGLIALARISDDRSQHLEIHEVASGERIPVTAPNAHVWSGGTTSDTSSTLTFSPDGRYFYYTTDKWHEFQRLMRFDIAARSHEAVLRYDWDIRSIAFSEDGARLAVAVNENARQVLYVYDAETIELLGSVNHANESVDSYVLTDRAEEVIYIARSAQMPGDIFIEDLAAASRIALATSLSDTIDAADLVHAQPVTYSAHDGLHVPGLLYKPHGASVANPVPALVMIHGGPGGQARVGYEPWVQFVVNRGYAVFAVNHRGSAGYGKTFYHMADQAHGKADLRDIVAAKEFLNTLDFVQRGQIAVFGASYGGFLTLAALTDYPDAFKAGIDIFGITNWSRTFRLRPPWWATTWTIREYGMGDNADEAYWDALSPLNNAERITKPLLVLQGANDPRVHKIESDELVERVRRNGIPVQYVVFDDEGHGFRKRANQVVAFSAIIEFLDNHLGSTDNPAHVRP